MELIVSAFEGISDQLVFGLGRDEVYDRLMSLGIDSYEKGGDREWIEALDLVIHYSEKGAIDGFEFFMGPTLEVALLYEGEDLLKKSYEELYSFLTEHDFFVIRFNDSIISLGTGIVVGYSTEKERNIESIYLMSDKERYKKTIIEQITDFY